MFEGTINVLLSCYLIKYLNDGKNNRLYQPLGHDPVVGLKEVRFGPEMLSFLLKFFNFYTSLEQTMYQNPLKNIILGLEIQKVGNHLERAHPWCKVFLGLLQKKVLLQNLSSHSELKITYLLCFAI